MVKLQDGSLVMASQLIHGEGEDDNGNQLTFVQTRNTKVPSYTAESDMTDGSGRKKVYLFDLFDTQVRVDVKVVEPDQTTQVSEQEVEPKPDDKGGEPPKAKTEARIITTTPAAKSHGVVGKKNE